MEEEVVKRNRNTTTFTKQSCKRIKEELCAQAKRSYTDKQLRNKYNLLRQKHKDFKSLLKETSIGFSVVAGQVNKLANKFRKKGCVLYEKLCIIFGDTTATGSSAHPSTLDNDDDDAMSKSPSIRNQESSFDEDGSKRRGKSTSTTSSLSTKKAKFSLALAETLTVYNETAKRKMKMYENSMTSTKHHLLDEYIEALNQIDAISGEVYAKAIEKFESEVSRALFLKMPGLGMSSQQECNLAKAIWFNTPMGLRAELVDVNSWEQWKDWFMADFNRPPNLTFQEMLITALCVVETMWFERNSTVHVETRSPAQKVLLNVNNKIRDHLKVAANDVVEFCEWHPPPESWLCCNCDISFDEGGVVLATVVRDGKGNIVTIKTERSLTTDPLIGEGLAVCMAAELMLEMRVKQVIFQSDNMVVATNLSTELGKDIHFKLTNISKRFHQLCLQFTSWGIGHLNRKCNYMAHNVAKWAKETRTIGLTKSTDVDPTVLTDYLDWRKHAG
ncbi:hypothetical protein F8388_000661 [Cannabis sativa]|uniref:RNase H type-1 domain-containing protein n=1 Tax=Cannabis sativa TaxID=3483 RepID=A0A7J6HBA4_CANSA|nr:hypothetical protein F8388_000661 [Cannabis sativa]